MVSVTVYLDYNATAPLRPEALAAMLPILRSVGNAASPHALGREAAAEVATARSQLAELLGCSAGELIFTSGATEANNHALRAAAPLQGQLVTSAVEHPAVLETARALAHERRDLELVVLPVDENGMLDMDGLHRAVASGQPTLVSIMAANNETGVLTDLARVVEIARAAGAVIHSDATQLVGRLPIDLSILDVDLLSLSAHKFGGPQGVGALFIRRGLRFDGGPLLYGGGQERGLRAGTLNVAGIVGAGAAAAATREHLATEGIRVRVLRDRLERALLDRIEGACVNGRDAPRLPNVTSLTFDGAPADAVLAAMPHVAASDGSACASGAPTPSHVLLAMGRTRAAAEQTIRFSLGYGTSDADIDHAIEATVQAVTTVRALLQRDTASSAAAASQPAGREEVVTAGRGWLATRGVSRNG